MESEVFVELVRNLVGKARLPRWERDQVYAAARIDARRLLERFPHATLAQVPAIVRATNMMAA